MAFTGTPVVQFVSERKVRITGVSLAAAVNGTIALHQHVAGPDIRLPAWFAPEIYDSGHGDVPLAASIECSVQFAAAVNTAPPIAVAKSGTTEHDFLITVKNTTDGDPGIASGLLEIYIEFH